MSSGSPSWGRQNGGYSGEGWSGGPWVGTTRCVSMQGLTREARPHCTGTRKIQAKPRQKKTTRHEIAREGRPGASKPCPGIKKGCLYRKPKFILLKESVKQFQESGRHSRCGCCFQTQQRNLSRLSSRARLLQAPGKKDNRVPWSLRPGVS